MKTETLKADILIKDTFTSRSIKKSTQEKYLESMWLFCELVKKAPDELILEAEEEIKNGTLMRLRQVRRHLLDFKEYLINEKKYSPMNVALKMSAVKSFYSAFEIDLPRNLLKEKNVHPLRENSNNNFTKKHIQQMAIYAPSLRNRAIVLTMKSSGLARRETIDLDYRQFREGYDIQTQVTTISMRREKVGLDFVTFIDPEGTLAIIDYLKSVGRISKDAVFDSKYDALPLFTNTGREDRIVEKNFCVSFWYLAKKMNVYNVLSRSSLNPIRSHNLRKFFRTTLLHAGMDDFLINYMMGHHVDRTQIAYYLNDVEKLKKIYIQHMDALAINSDDVKESDIFKENQKLKSELEHVKSADSMSNDAIAELLNDEAILRKLFDKFKAFEKK